VLAQVLSKKNGPFSLDDLFGSSRDEEIKEVVHDQSAFDDC
jgi:hypothetical protein